MTRVQIETIILWVLIGVVIGIMFKRWTSMETQIADHNARLQVLESDYAERMRLKACAKKFMAVAAKCVHKLSFGFVKLLH